MAVMNPEGAVADVPETLESGMRWMMRPDVAGWAAAGLADAVPVAAGEALAGADQDLCPTSEY
jgi:hypothetical protein